VIVEGGRLPRRFHCADVPTFGRLFFRARDTCGSAVEEALFLFG